MSGKFRIAAGAALIAAVGAVAACASGDRADSPTPAQSNAVQSAAATQMYTDAQVQAFVAARAEISQLTPGTTAEAQAQNQAQIGAILQRHQIAPDVYNAIGTRARTDQTLANRIAAAGVGTSFTDAQLQAFATASAEIDPITRSLATATPEQQQQATLQIRQILARNNLTFEQYNGIAARAQTDDALAARITALREPAAPAATEPPSAQPPTNQ
jgi:hypothetical protein